MKTILYCTAIALISLFTVSCTQAEKLPEPVTSIEQAKTFITGKQWQVIKVATVSGSRESVFDKDESKNEPIVAPPIEALNWLGNSKESNNSSDFINSYYEESLKIYIALNKDSIATTKGMDNDLQTFSIQHSEENKPKGIKLSLTSKSDAFAELGGGTFTATYYILGANESKLYLLTPNKVNDLNVVYLLEAK